MSTTVIEMDQVAEFYGQTLTAAIHRGAMRGLFSAAERMVNIIITQTIPATIPQPVDRAIFKAGWKFEETADGAMFFNTAPYAGVIEWGGRAENVKVGRKMLDALTEWVARKGIASDKRNARRMAWAIAVSMAKTVTVHGEVLPGQGRGIFKGKGHRIMESANEQLPAVVEEEVAREVAAELNRV